MVLASEEPMIMPPLLRGHSVGCMIGICNASESERDTGPATLGTTAKAHLLRVWCKDCRTGRSRPARRPSGTVPISRCRSGRAG